MATKKDKSTFSIQNDKGILLICMIISSTFWLVMEMNKTYSTERTAKLQFILPEGKVFSELPPEEFDIQVESTGWRLMYDFFFGDKQEIVLDLNFFSSNTIESGQMIQRIKDNLSGTLEVKRINFPSGKQFIALNYEDEFQKLLPVRLNGEVSFGKGYGLADSIQLLPDSVLVKAPFSILENKDYWQTKRVEAMDLKESYTEIIDLQLPEEGQITLSPANVQLNIPVEELTENTIILPIQIKNPPEDSIRIFPTQVQLKFVVGLSQFNQITADSFLIEADLSQISANSVNNTLPLTLLKQPQSVRGANFSPPSIEFFVIEK